MDSTLLKGLVVLDRAVSSTGPVSVSVLARELSLPKSSVHRSLSTLREAGYLLFNEEEKKYYPSLKLALMGQSVSANFPFRTVVLPYLEHLAAITGETAHFAVLEGETTVFVASSVPKVTMASVVPENFSLPWYRTAFGIAAVSALPEVTAAAMMTDQDIPDAVISALREAYQKDPTFLSSVEERGTFEIAMPIHTHWQSSVGVIGISGPAVRLQTTNLQKQFEAVKSAAADAFAETGAATRQPTRKPA